MGKSGLKEKNSASFLDLSSVLGTYNRWCNRVQKVNYVGDLELLTKRPFLAVLGGRKLSVYGSRAVTDWVGKIASLGRVTIVVGDLSGVERKVLKVCEARGARVVLVSVLELKQAQARYGWVVEAGGLIISIFGLGLPRFLVVFRGGERFW
jgi:predicted Rossmann fold nucleotide-binding protein DprA/Smf involved in DNA uptake